MTDFPEKREKKKNFVCIVQTIQLHTDRVLYYGKWRLPAGESVPRAGGWRMFLDFLWTILGKIVFFTGAIGGKNSFPKPLSKEDEEKYLALAAKGDKEAKDILIRHNMRLVAHIVKKYTGAAETDDLISVAVSASSRPSTRTSRGTARRWPPIRRAASKTRS